MRRFIAAIILAIGLASTLSAQPIKLGAIGDSLIDEHFDQGFPTSKNALELLRDSGQIDLGSLGSAQAGGSWPDARLTGYEYNWALAGSTTGSLISGNQHTDLATQISAEGITKAVMVVGSNDLFPFPQTGNPLTSSAYESIYNGWVTQAEIDAVANQAINDVVLAAQTLKNTGVDLVVATAPEYGIAPFTISTVDYTDPAKRDLVDDVMLYYNDNAVDRFVNEVGVPVVDIYSLTKDIWGDHGSENATFTLGGVDIQLDGTSATPDSDAAFVDDGIHPNNAIGGIFANLFMTAFNEEHGDSFTLFTEEQILFNGGPNLGAQYTSDTFNISLGGKTYSDYVISAVPEPSSLALLGFTAIGLAGWRHRKQKRKQVTFPA